jgi:hypothetical protein
MTRRGVFWMSIALLALVLAGCGGSADASADASDGHPTAKPSTSTTVAPTTTTTVPPPYSFDGSVPPPKLVNTGTDYEAIIRSLDAYSHWLYAHNPDRALVGEVAVPASTPYNRIDGDLSDLATDELRVYDTASQLTSVQVVSTQGNAVSLRATYSDDHKVLVDRAQKVIDNKVLPASSTFVVLLTSDDTGRWRLAAVDPADPVLR